MNKVYIIKGMKNDYSKKILFKKTKLQVNLTIDYRGATLSVGEGDIQYVVPFDGILRDIKEQLSEQSKN